MAAIGPQAAAALAGIRPPVALGSAGGIGPGGADIGDVHMADLAQIAAVDQLGDARPRRVEAQFVVDHVQPFGLARRVQHPARLARVHRGGFLAQDMRAPFNRAKHHRRVHHRGRGDADEVERMRVQHLFPIVIDRLDPVRLGGGPGAGHPA